MGMSLYEIDREIESLVDEETGEVREDAMEQFESLRHERVNKIESIALYIKNLDAEAIALKTEVYNLSSRMKACEKKRDNLKVFLNDVLGGEKFKTSKCSVTFRHNQKVNVYSEESAIIYLTDIGRDDCIRLSKPEISKDAVKKLLKEGFWIAGAELVDTVSVGVK